MSVLNALLLASTAIAPVQTAEAPSFRFHQDYVLGTSMDIAVIGGDQAAAAAIADAALKEIARLDKVLSGWRADSELARLNASAGPFAASSDLFAVIDRCEAWRTASGGAFSARVGAVETLWRGAETAGQAPSPPLLQKAAYEAEAAPVRLDAAAQTIDRAGVQFSVDALAKGYIIDAALAAARSAATAGQGVLLDIGGDLRCAGAAPVGGWRIGLARGGQADNLAPAQSLTIAGGAVATSGAGARDLRIGDEALSHTFDPKSGAPNNGALVTVTASTAADADALATALGVMPAEQGLALAAQAGAQARIVDPSGQVHATRGWSDLLTPALFNTAQSPPPLIRIAAAPAAPARGKAWPAGFSVDIGYEIPPPPSGRAKPPFVVIFITDEAGKLVRTLYHLGDHPGRYLDSNYVWYRAFAAAGHENDLFSVTRPSRRAGRYTATWDGKDDAGAPVPQGRYTINVEISREHGGHSLQAMPMTLGAAPASAASGATDEAGPASVRYGPGAGGAI